MGVIEIIRGLFGLSVLLLICYLVSNNRKEIKWPLVLTGIALQIVIAFCLIKIPLIKGFFEYIVKIFTIMIESSTLSAQFLFGDLAKPGTPYGFAFLILPTVIFFSALSSVLYYFGILQKI